MGPCITYHAASLCVWTRAVLRYDSEKLMCSTPQDVLWRPANNLSHLLYLVSA